MIIMIKRFVGISNIKCWLPVFICLFFATNSGTAQKSEITGLAYKNQTVNEADITILLPGKGSNLSRVSKGFQMPSGTKMIVPPFTIVKLKSPGGTQVLKSTTDKSFEYTVSFTAESENHAVKGFGAQIVNTVTKRVGYSYRNTNEKGTTAAAKGTVFTFNDLSQGKSDKATISTNEGTIQITDEIPVTVDGKLIENKGKEKTTKSISKLQSAGDGEFTSSNAPQRYDSYDDAVKDLLNEINQFQNSPQSDPEDLADNLMCLGDLYMDMDQPQQAIKPYSQAASYYEITYGDDDLDAIEAKLSLAEAYLESDDEAKASSIAEENITILENMLNDDEDDFAFAKDSEGEEAIEAICEEIKDICGSLGWAYDIAGDEQKSEEYYQRAEADCE